MDDQCPTSYDWAKNSQGQDPCVTAAYLFGACIDGNFSHEAFKSLTGSSMYPAPSADQANNCTCSTVTYSLVSACLDCQDRIAPRWSAWRSNCADPAISRFAADIPKNTSVPSWAYLNVSISDEYNAQAAERHANNHSLPEPTNGDGVAIPTDLSNRASSTNVGAIAGGVVGGVLFLGLVVSLAVWYILKRRRRAYMAPSAQFRASAFVKRFDPYHPVSSPTDSYKDHHDDMSNALPTLFSSSPDPITASPSLNSPSQRQLAPNATSAETLSPR